MSLKDQRNKKGFSQSQLGVAANMSTRTIQHYEQGSRRLDGANLETLCTLAIALDCSIYDLLESEDLKKKYKMAK